MQEWRDFRETVVKKSGVAKLVWIALCVLWPLSGSTAVATWVTQVTDVMIDSTLYGGCMAKVTSGPVTNGLSATCNNSWVSMDCFGNFYAKADGNRKLSAAQLAYVSSGNVRIRVRDTYTYNVNYCVVERMDNAQ